MKLSLRPAARTVAIAGATAVATLALAVPGVAMAHGHHSGHAPARAVPAPPAQPTRADQIQNLDQVKTAIKAYYGDTVDGTDPDGSPRHVPSATGAYANEMHGIEARAAGYLAARMHPWKHHDHVRPGDTTSGRPAIVLDVDDTTLNTYDYEIWSNFVYNPASNATFVNDGAFPAVPYMPQLVNWAADNGYTIFYLTGRPASQLSGTVTNLTNVGYPAPVTGDVFLKDMSDPWLSSCAPNCTTIQYKSLTRAHIESLGYDIVGNFGDQYSDLKGGYADRAFKLPNPMYYLP
ncbi:MAG TPA: HAD family acid phosphatase [Jatrophihabitantaceae bacterium]|nr:HAD family acid phosphatase [Jatrophihabitantaceae bacterium]